MSEETIHTDGAPVLRVPTATRIGRTAGSPAVATGTCLLLPRWRS